MTAAVSAAVLTVVPAYVFLASVAGAPRPPAAERLPGGVWHGVDAAGEPVRLRFNRWNFVLAESDDGGRRRGAVEWDAAGAGFAIAPLLGWGEREAVAVQAWPTDAAPDALVAGGVAYTRRLE